MLVQKVEAKHSAIVRIDNTYMYIHEEGTFDIHATKTFKEALLWETDPEVALELEDKWKFNRYSLV